MPWALFGAEQTLSRSLGGRTHYAALFVGDPSAGGVEVTPQNAPDYERVEIPVSHWDFSQDAANGRAVAENNAPVIFPLASDAYTVTPDHVGLFTAFVGGDLVLYDTISITQPVAGGRVRIVVGALRARALL